MFSLVLYCNQGRRPFVGRQKAFSLVEVAVALGIIAFSLLSILGVVPVGLTTLRDAMNQTVETHIVQEVTGTALLTPFSKLENLDQRTSYYDEEGSFLTNSPEPPPGKTRYWVTTQVTTPVFPGAEMVKSETMKPNLKSINIQIANAPSASAVSRRVSNYVVQVPNCGN